MKTIMKLRFLLPLLVLGYVGLGGFVVPYVNIVVGHGIMAGLAVFGLLVTVVGFVRHDVDEQDRTWRKYAFLGTVVLSIGWAATVVTHIVCIVTGNLDTMMIFASELFLVSFSALAVLVTANNIRS